MQAQADEEMKGEAPGRQDLDIGGYEDDSEDEREIKEQEESQKEVVFSLSEDGAAQVASVTEATLVVCGCLNSQSLAKIMYGSDWQEVGEVTSKKASTGDDASSADREPKTILKLYAYNASSNFYFALPEIEKLTGVAVN